jgi:E3 ubiquitin-protein ligase HUWE1
VPFVDEFGCDAGGLLGEWFYLVSLGILNGNNGILVDTQSGSRRYLPGTVGENVMEFVGKSVAKAMREGQVIPIRFLKVVYRYILEGLDNVVLDLDMNMQDHPEHARALNWILEHDPSSEGWQTATQDMSFSVDIVSLGVHRVHSLIPDGSDRTITQFNKAEYVERIVEFKLRQSIRLQLERFLAGFYSVLPRELLGGTFTPDELELVISGRSEIDVGDLRGSAEYLGYSETDEQIGWFWEIVGNTDQDHLSLLVKFTSGTPIAPIGGFAGLPLKIARVGLHGNPAYNPLPSAHTCSNQLDLPEYTSKEEMRDKLGSEGCGFA